MGTIQNSQVVLVHVFVEADGSCGFVKIL